MKNRILATCMVLFAITTLYAYDFRYGDLCYNIIDNNEVEITYEVYWSSSNYSKLESVDIANSVTYNGKIYTVTSIGDDAFCRCSRLTSIAIPSSITSIGNYAFRGCSGLTSISIPNSVTSIGKEAFYGCSGLTSITIPNSITNIGSYAFDDTPWYRNYSNGLIYIGCVLYRYKGYMPQGTNIVVKDGIKTIAYGAFDNYENLTSITIPNSVTSIGDYAFAGCSGLTSITIPNSVTSIGYDAFQEVLNIVYTGAATGSPWGAKSINGCVDGYLIYSDTVKQNLLFCGRSAIGTIVIPNSVTSIGNSAFYGCSGLISVTIPNSVTSIGSSAFSGCSGLISVTIPNSVTSIGSSAFSGCSRVTSITIPNSVTSIEDRVFYGCSRLTSITIPNSVTSIGEEAFYSCSGLTSITIPNSVTSIEDRVFYGCSGLTSITIPNSVTSIGSSAFAGCSGLTSVTIGNSVTSIGDYAFYGCSRLTSISISSNVESIGSSAFSGCSGLISITISNSVRSIGNSAFYNCSRLDTVIWNAKNCTVERKSGQYSPFYVEKGESNISSFIFGNGVESVPDYLCYGLNKLTSVTIPNSVQSVGGQAFANCKYLEEVSFGTGIKEIGENAFAGDERIYSVTCYADVTPTIYESTFSGVSSNAELHVLANLVKKYKVNEYWSKFTIVPISVDNTTNGTLTVRPSDTDATFTWPADSNADSYTLTIQKGDVVFCRLIFNGEGQLTSIAFAPARGEAKHTLAALLSAEGYKFTVTGLDEASHYTYQIVVKDWENQVLNTYNGEFNTNGYTAIDGTMVQESGIGVRKVLRDGQVYILRGGKTYTLTGTEVF